jgi:MFS family permease
MTTPNHQPAPPPPAWLAWTVWGLGALFYLSGFYQRMAPAVMTSELMADFGLAGAGLGHLSAFYFYAYVVMQIPTGLLADTWGPRRLLTLGALTAGAGSLLFAWAPSLAWALAGRLLIGGSVAVAWVVCLKLAAHWFPARRYALISGLALLTGVVGAVTAGTPLRLAIDAFGWRAVMAVSGLASLAIAAATWLIVRDDPSRRGYASQAPDPSAQAPRPPSEGVLAGLGRVFARRNVLLLFLAPGGMVGAVLSFSGLWGVPYLQARYGLPPAQGAAVCSLLLVCWAVGGPVLGGLSDRIGRRKPLLLGGACVSLAAWLAMVYLPVPLGGFTALAGLAGFASGGMIITFAFARESAPGRLAGTVSGVANMGVILGPTLAQPVMGWILDLLWAGGAQGGVRVYTETAFQAALGFPLAWIAASVLLLALTRETHCRPQE